MAKKYKVNSFEGFQDIVVPENSDIKKIRFSIIKSQSETEYSGETQGEESVFVMTEGMAKFSINGKISAEMTRKNVFSEPPAAVYIPPYSKYGIKFYQKTEICVASSPASGKTMPRVIAPKDMAFSRKGNEGYFRNVTEIVTEKSYSERLIIGETISDPGNWASYPPHKHDTDNLPDESAMEEIYYFKVNPKNGFGAIRIFDEFQDNIFVINNNEVITIPRGYHPIAVPPGYQIYYLWILAGDAKKLVPMTHPDFRFIVNT